MKIAAGHQDLGVAFGDAFDLVAPAPRAFDRRFHRFGAGVHRQSAVEARDAAQLLQERAQRGAVIGAGRDGHAFELPVRRGHQARMQVAMADGGIRTHHVDVFAAFYVPDQAVARMVDHHRDGLVVARAVAGFLANEILRGRVWLWRPWRYPR